MFIGMLFSHSPSQLKLQRNFNGYFNSALYLVDLLWPNSLRFQTLQLNTQYNPIDTVLERVQKIAFYGGDTASITPKSIYY
jgi:ABC-2 type transport system permease protein